MRREGGVVTAGSSAEEALIRSSAPTARGEAGSPAVHGLFMVNVDRCKPQVRPYERRRYAVDLAPLTAAVSLTLIGTADELHAFARDLDLAVYAAREADA